MITLSKSTGEQNRRSGFKIQNRNVTEKKMDQFSDDKDKQMRSCDTAAQVGSASLEVDLCLLDAVASPVTKTNYGLMDN